MHPEDRSFIERSLEEAVRERSSFDIEFRLALADGSIKHVQGVGRPALGAAGEVESYTGTTVDISERKRGQALFAGEKRLLEMIAAGVALEQILNSLCLIIEDYRSGTLASILLLRSDGLHLDSVAGPSLPKGWRQEMEKLPIGPCAGSCGTAAYRASPVIVSDIASDPLWEVPEHRAAALSHGLRASWSNPILSSEGKVLGTFCIYSREMRSPSAHDLGVMEKATHIARVAIERDRVTLWLPIIGELVRKFEIGRFARTLGVLLSNGVSSPRALALVGATIGNRIIAQAIEDVAARLKEGGGLSEPLARTGRFPSLATELIHIGEETGRLEEMLHELAEIYDEELERNVQRLIALLVPALTIGMGLVVALMIAAVMTAVLSINDLAI